MVVSIYQNPPTRASLFRIRSATILRSMDRIKWHRCDEAYFTARLADNPHDAWARLVVHEGEWWWRVFWDRRFDRWGICADRQEASDAANVALQELLATTEVPGPAPRRDTSVEARYGASINCHPERLGRR